MKKVLDTGNPLEICFFFIFIFLFQLNTEFHSSKLKSFRSLSLRLIRLRVSLKRPLINRDYMEHGSDLNEAVCVR